MLSSSESSLTELEEAISDQIHHMNGTKIAPFSDLTWPALVHFFFFFFFFEFD